MAKKKRVVKSVKSTANKATVSKSSVALPPYSSDVIATSLASVQPTMIKLCRLCEAKDGPFLNIFGKENEIAKKIKELLPIVIAEYDELPHKICFRCSAKVEELHEFVQKCIRTQESLAKSIGKNEAPVAKTNLARHSWEEKLNKTKMSNDDICNALIKKAMEGITDYPLLPLPVPEEIKPLVSANPPAPKKLTKAQLKMIEMRTELDQLEKDDEKNLLQPIKQVKLAIDKVAKKKPQEGVKEHTPTRLTRSKPIEPLLDGLTTKWPKKPDVKEDSNDKSNVQGKPNKKDKISEKTTNTKNKKVTPNIEKEEPNVSEVKTYEPQAVVEKKIEEPQKPAFDIMQFVSSIKVNGVGYLFQCKLCNRNFLKKEVVLSHGCAKTGVPKADTMKPIYNMEPPIPRKSNVKVISTLSIDHSKQRNLTVQDDLCLLEDKLPKTKAGPASRTKRFYSCMSPAVEPVQSIKQPSPPPPIPPPPSLSANTVMPSVEVPSNFPGTQSRYKLVPGPNNSFTLVEDTSFVPPPSAENILKTTVEQETSEKVIHKRKGNKQDNAPSGKKKNKESDKKKADVIIDLDDTIDDAEASGSPPIIPHSNTNAATTMPPPPSFNTDTQSQPYPVGLFQNIPSATPSPGFTTPAMRKQSYTVVQTGNPSKLLISTKGPVSPEPVQQEVNPPNKGKKGKKNKNTSQVEHEPTETAKQPFSVTIEDSAPAKDPNDGFFTFINVDPLLQPSYVLPTHSIIQESQISTSTPLVANTTQKPPKEVYKCESCDLEFSREKKLLAHIPRCSKNDDDDDWNPGRSRKKSKKS